MMTASTPIHSLQISSHSSWITSSPLKPSLWTTAGETTLTTRLLNPVSGETSYWFRCFCCCCVGRVCWCYRQFKKSSLGVNVCVCTGVWFCPVYRTSQRTEIHCQTVLPSFYTCKLYVMCVCLCFACLCDTGSVLVSLCIVCVCECVSYFVCEVCYYQCICLFVGLCRHMWGEASFFNRTFLLDSNTDNTMTEIPCTNHPLTTFILCAGPGEWRPQLMTPAPTSIPKGERNTGEDCSLIRLQ